MTPPDEKNSSRLLPQHMAAMLLSFPAYKDAKKVDLPGAALFQFIADAYENDQLTEEQDLILEAILYLYNLTDDFDLRRALTLWDQADFLQFQQALVDRRTLST